MQSSISPSFSTKTPDGDTHTRDICNHCKFVHYINPKIVVGSVVRHDGKILLCRRAIEPRHGFWTIPAGYLELKESPVEGALREAREEANADLEISGLLSVYTVHRLSQVQLIHRATLKTPEFSAGEESLEVALFSWNDIPWEKIAFPTVHWALEHDRRVEEERALAPFTNPDQQKADF